MSETTNTTDFLDIYRKAALFISPNIFQEIKQTIHVLSKIDNLNVIFTNII